MTKNCPGCKAVSEKIQKFFSPKRFMLVKAMLNKNCMKFFILNILLARGLRKYSWKFIQGTQCSEFKTIGKMSHLLSNFFPYNFEKCSNIH